MSENRDGRGPGQESAILRTERLGREVDGKALVTDVSVQVTRGEVVAVVGPSGSGKSSLLRLLNRLDEPTSGTVYLEGQDYRTLPPRVLRQRVGMVMQTPFLFPGTVADNIRFGPAQFGETVSDATIEALLRQVGLEEFAERKVDGLSGGEAQRVSLARALANEPHLLLLDEPTSALDESARAGVEALIQRVMQERGLTCVMVTHDTGQAARMASRVMVLEAGRITATGTPEEVLRA